jgi:hypothetical protein
MAQLFLYVDRADAISQENGGVRMAQTMGVKCVGNFAAFNAWVMALRTFAGSSGVPTY